MSLVKQDGHRSTQTACNGNLEIVRYLLDNGADMTIVNSGGCTPLHTAAEHGHFEIAKLLLERGADKEVIADSGSTPLQTAIVGKNTSKSFVC